MDYATAIEERLVAHLTPAARGESALDVRIGLGYTAVRLESGAAGIAYTFRPGPAGGCAVFRADRPLAGRPASELIACVLSQDPIEAAVGLATANALAARALPEPMAGDVLDALNLLPGDEVGMVGYFGPLVPEVRRRVRALHVFETDPAGPDILPQEAARRWLPRCQVTLITSTAIINHTLGSLLNWAANCRQVVLLGPSTPLAPEVFQGTPVVLLSGVEVTDPAAVLRAVSEGGGMPAFRGHVRKVTVEVPLGRSPGERGTGPEVLS
jgi:uncharacterized protein (DUF4213/DUF364 family)